MTDQGAMADVRDMYVVHVMLRRELSQAPALIRAVEEGDTKRSEVVGDHVELLCLILHSHHAGEDELLWPKLLERGADEVASVVHLMEGHHEAIEKSNQEITAALGPWRRTASAGHRDALAGALDRLIPVLVEHTAIVPIVGPRMYASHAKRVYGTATPPRSVN